MSNKRIKQERRPSSGSLNFIETQNGQLSLKISMDEQEGTEEHILKRIQAALAGLAYYYERNSEDVDNIGWAFLDGMKVGRQATPEAPKKNKSPYSKSSIGFGADV